MLKIMKFAKLSKSFVNFAINPKKKDKSKHNYAFTLPF